MEIISIDEIHRFQKLVRIDERADNNKTAKNTPKPKILSAEQVAAIACTKFFSDTVAETMIPDQRDNSKDEPDSYLAVDDIESGTGARVPLWMFGFLY